MQCGICSEVVDAARRRPKVLPCGHTTCLACLEGRPERRCPECRLEFACAAENLPDNVMVVRLLASSTRGPTMWCSHCKALAKPECFDDHNLRSAKATMEDECEQLHVQVSRLAGKLPEALRQDGDGCPEQALRVLELARQPGTTLEVSVRGQRGEALSATWTNPPAAPAGQQGTEEAVEAVATNVLVLALAKKGLWQQSGEGVEHQEGRDGAKATTPGFRVAAELEMLYEKKIPDKKRKLLEATRREKKETFAGFQGLLGLEPLSSANIPAAQLKDELVQTLRLHMVRRLTNLKCKDDSAWSLQLLRLAAPHVEELQVHYVRREHLEAVFAMPRLRRLHLHGHSTRQSEYPAEVPPPPAHHAGLRWLWVDYLPRETTFGVLRAHAATLEELLLVVGTPGGGGWPRECVDLHAALGRCGLARLRRLVLLRWVCRHRKEDCSAQLRAVRVALPGVHVQCNSCEALNLSF